MFVRTKKRDDKTYLMIVESKRVGARIEQINAGLAGAPGQARAKWPTRRPADFSGPFL